MEHQKTEQGRPRGNMLLAEDAEIVRSAVKAATRYFGIRLQDLDRGGKWVTVAMRNASPLSVEIAERLFLAVQRPDKLLVRGKPAQGPSLLETQKAIELHRNDPAAHPLQQNPAMDYINAIFAAARVVELYARPMPGSNIFVIPGTALSLAKAIIDAIVEDLPPQIVGARSRRKLVERLAFYLDLSERPLRGVDGKALLPQLLKLGLHNRRELTSAINEQMPEENFFDIGPAVDALATAEEQRSAEPDSAAKRTRRKRQVVMPRIRRVVTEDAPDPR